MQGLRWLKLSDDDLDEFLGRGGTGVLSFAAPTNESPVSIPVSYGYNATENAFYYRLSAVGDGRKADLVERELSFVTYRETDDGWRSVVATGRLRALTDEPEETQVLESLRAIEIPIVDIFDRPQRETAFQYFRLEPETMTGRKEVSSEP
jgi:uncharacterized protein